MMGDPVEISLELSAGFSEIELDISQEINPIVDPPLDAIDIMNNGNYDVTMYKNAHVAVADDFPVLGRTWW